MDIKLIRNTTELTGTVYFEFLPGAYKGKTFTDESVYIEDGIFKAIEPVFVKYIPNFDRGAFTQVNRVTWVEIVTELHALSEHLANSKHQEDAAFKGMIDDFLAWLRNTLASNDSVTILGV